MKTISIFGLGYVGAVTAACFAARGYRIIGVDPNQSKVQCLESGQSPVVEAEMAQLVGDAHRKGAISATRDVRQAVAESEVSFISVGTPSQPNGSLDLTYVKEVCREIGEALREKSGRHHVVVRSTVLPGTTRSVVIPAIEAASGQRSGHDFVVSFNPEFLREGTAVADFFNPPFTVVGVDDPADADLVAGLYESLPAALHVTTVEAAEMVKYSCNAFHALKVAFMNEVGSVCRALGVEPATVADIFKTDTRLNVSTAYLTPGFAFGGSCLPKDLRALSYRGKELDLKLPLLESILHSNDEHLQRAIDGILSLGERRVGILGLSFKAGTDDLRESPIVSLVKRLLGEGFDLKIWDKNVALGRLIGSNRRFIEESIPHVGSLLRPDLAEVLDHGAVVVRATTDVPREAILARLRSGQRFVDVTALEWPAAVRQPV